MRGVAGGQAVIPACCNRRAWITDSPCGAGSSLEASPVVFSRFPTGETGQQLLGAGTGVGRPAGGETKAWLLVRVARLLVRMARLLVRVAWLLVRVAGVPQDSFVTTSWRPLAKPGHASQVFCRHRLRGHPSPDGCCQDGWRPPALLPRQPQCSTIRQPPAQLSVVAGLAGSPGPSGRTNRLSHRLSLHKI